MRPQQTIYECIIKINQAIINNKFWLGIDTLEDIKHHLNEAEKLVNIDQRVMLNFADDEKKIIMSCLSDREYEIKRMISYKMDEEACNTQLEKIKQIKSKFSA